MVCGQCGVRSVWCEVSVGRVLLFPLLLHCHKFVPLFKFLLFLYIFMGDTTKSGFQGFISRAHRLHTDKVGFISRVHRLHLDQVRVPWVYL